VSIFAEILGESLAEVAAILEEVDVKAGETILHKDDVGRCMYIIVERRVQSRFEVARGIIRMLCRCVREG
jgi:CRP-like cAMP-binding protein